MDSAGDDPPEKEIYPVETDKLGREHLSLPDIVILK